MYALRSATEVRSDGEAMVKISQTVARETKPHWRKQRRQRCPNCDGPILPGDLIEHEVPDGAWRHVDCDEALFVTQDPEEA